ncbi:MAG: hypothetical protein KBS60_01255 [Phascolarctobacterium sp.]|nr:hypothetical protein [Candidatus Phascolarctobacterium caballi]
MNNGKNFIVILLAAVLVFAAGYWAGIHSDGRSADEVRKQINSAQSNQQSITGSIGTAAQAVSESGRVIEELIDGLRQVRRQPAPEN